MSEDYQITVAEIVSSGWTYSHPGVRFDCRAAIRKQRTFLHGDNSRIWMAHGRRDCRVFWQDSESGETMVSRQFDGYLFVFFGLGMAKSRNAALASLRCFKRDKKIGELEKFVQVEMDKLIARHFMGEQPRFVQEECKLDVVRRLVDCPGGSGLGDQIYHEVLKQVQLQGQHWARKAKVLLSYEMVER
jgi:hypothetical protein